MRVAIIGAGPSGLSAAHDLALRGYGVDLFDADEQPGGLLRTGIPEYRLPKAVLDRDIERILALDVTFHGGMRLGDTLRLHEILDQAYDAVYLAIGATRGQTLEPGGDADRLGCFDALSYLRAAGKCEDIPSAENVIVIGGGNAAIDAARTASRAGARVSIACLESREDMPAIRQEIKEAEREGIQMRPGLRLLRKTSTGLRFATVEKAANGSLDPKDYVTVQDSERVLPCDQVIMAIGQLPDTRSFCAEDPDLGWTRDGLLRVDPVTCATKHPRVFAGGDLTPGERTVTGSMAMGQRAAWGIDLALRGADSANRRMPPPKVATRPRSEMLDVDRIDHEKREHAYELPTAERMGNFAEVAGTFSEARARAEADRCLICGLCGNCNACIDTFGCPAFYREDGVIQINPGLCTGCGVCAELCPNSAIVEVVQEKPVSASTSASVVQRQ